MPEVWCFCTCLLQIVSFAGKHLAVKRKTAKGYLSAGDKLLPWLFNAGRYIFVRSFPFYHLKIIEINNPLGYI
jgi:hypothetical protein